MTTTLRGGDNFDTASSKINPAFNLVHTIQQTISGSTHTKISLGTARVDNASGADLTNDRWVVPAGKSGVYQIIGTLRFTDGVQGQYIRLYKNGSVEGWGGAGDMDYGDVTYNGDLKFTTILSLDVSDYVELYAWRGASGVTHIINDGWYRCSLQGFRVSE